MQKLISALLRAQQEFDPVLKDRSNPIYHSKYADLQSVIAATQPALQKNGLVLVQFPHSDLANKGVGVRTILLHESGEFLEHAYTLPAAGEGKEGRERYTAQMGCAAITYARRAAYMGVLGIAPEDDDGNMASGYQPERDKQPKREAASRPAKVNEAPAQTGTKPHDSAKDLKPATGVTYLREAPPATPDPQQTAASSPAASTELPDAETYKRYCNTARLLVTDLTQNGLGASRGMGIDAKFIAYFKSVTGASRLDQATVQQWNNFFEMIRHDKEQVDGIKKLAAAVNSLKKENQ